MLGARFTCGMGESFDRECLHSLGFPWSDATGCFAIRLQLRGSKIVRWCSAASGRVGEEASPGDRHFTRGF
jgi:hypothetical protein